MFGTFGLPAELADEGAGGALRLLYRRKRSRIGDFPSVLLSEPAGTSWPGDHHPRPGQVRALFVSAGNPVLSVPNGAELGRRPRLAGYSVGIDLTSTRPPAVATTCC